MQLNPVQQFVADHKSGPLLVLAPPGSGKTASITQRAANMIKAGLPSRHLLLVTFSRKACDEMSERISQLVETPPTVSTLHRLGIRIIRNNPEKCGRLHGVNIADRPKDLYKKACHAFDIVKDNTIDETYRMLNTIRFTKTYHETQQYSDALEQHLSDGTNQSVINLYVQVFKRFDELKAKENVIDLSDGIILAVDALRKHHSLRQKYAIEFPFIMVDEAQDSNWAQYRLISLIAQEHKNLVLVGDDDQTIYQFQGADPELLQVFKQEFNARVIQYEKNYRSSPAVVNLSDLLIGRNTKRFSKSVYSMNSGADFSPPELVHSATNELFQEALIARIRADRAIGVPYADMAVLYRLNKITDGVVDAIQKANIPFKVLGGRKRKNEPEIDAFGYFLRLMLNQYDYPAFKSLGRLYAVNNKDLDKAVNASRRSSDPMITPLEACATKCSNNAKSFARECSSTLISIRDATPEDAFKKLRSSPTFTQCMYRIRKRNEKESAASTDQDAYLDEYESRIQQYMSRKAIAHLSYVEKYRLLTEDHFTGEDLDMGDPEGVTIGSMHKSKGMEWASVHVIGLSEELLPFYQSSDEPDQDDIESERSIAYVAITRARNKLFMYHSRELMMGSFIRKDLAPSRFLTDMKYSIAS